MKGQRNKFGARKTSCRNGHVHASKREATRCDELHLLLRAGDIEDLQQQPRFMFAVNGNPVKGENGQQLRYTADFRFVDRHSGATIIEDAKGHYRDDAWALRKAFFKALHPELVLREV